jgi:hypothetical protein
MDSIGYSNPLGTPQLHRRTSPFVRISRAVASRARAATRDQWFGTFFALAYLAFFVILFTEESSVPIAGR